MNIHYAVIDRCKLRGFQSRTNELKGPIKDQINKENREATPEALATRKEQAVYNWKGYMFSKFFFRT